MQKVNQLLLQALRSLDEAHQHITDAEPGVVCTVAKNNIVYVHQLLVAIEDYDECPDIEAFEVPEVGHTF